MIEIVRIERNQDELDRRLIRRYAIEAIEFLYEVMMGRVEGSDLEERIHAAEILATTAGLPTKGD